MIRVGEKLQEARIKKGMTLDQVAKATKIRVSFLQAIEQGEYDKLPGPNYAHGFVKNYLEFLELPTREYVALFRREYDENEQRKLVPQGLVGKENISLKKFSIKQIAWLSVAIIAALFVYLLFQYRAAFWPPMLTVATPQQHAVVSGQMVEVKGTTDTDAVVTVNNLPAYVDANGQFIKEIPVFPGNTTITVKAVNTFGKIATIQRQIQVKLSQ